MEKIAEETLQELLADLELPWIGAGYQEGMRIRLSVMDQFSSSQPSALEDIEWWYRDQ